MNHFLESFVCTLISISHRIPVSICPLTGGARAGSGLGRERRKEGVKLEREGIQIIDKAPAY